MCYSIYFSAALCYQNYNYVLIKGSSIMALYVRHKPSDV